MGKNFCEEEKSSELRIKVSQVFSKQSFLSSSSQVRKLKDFFREKKNSNELRNNSFQENRLSQIAFTFTYLFEVTHSQNIVNSRGFISLKVFDKV